jgi:hypothetical protein
MGLLDGNLGIDLTDPKLALAAGLLGGTGNFGANLGRGLLGAQQSAQAKNQFGLVQQNAERANRANDLQQISGLYQTLQTQDMIQAIRDKQAGVPHVPNPALGTLQAKMSELAGLPPMAGGARPVAPPDATQAPSQPSPFTPGSNPSLPPVGQGFLGANPGFQPPPQAPQQQQGTPPPMQQPQQGQPQGQDPFASQRDDADMLALLARKPELMAENRYKMTLPTVSRGVSFNPATGMPMAGFVDNVPVQFQNGRPQVIQSDIPQAIAQRAGAVSAAQAGATSPYKTEMVTDASGRQVPRFLPQLPGYPGGQQGQQIPPAVQAAADRGQPFEATVAPGGQPQFNPNPGKSQDPFADVPQRYAPQGMGQSTFDKEMASKQAESASVTASKLGSQADAANQRMALNNQALKLVDQSDTGPKAALIGDVKNWLVSRVGIPESSFQNTPSATIALQKDLLNSATQRAKQQFGSRITQSEVMLMLTRGSPNVDMTKASIKYLIDSDNAMQTYQIKQANDFGSYLQKGGDPMRFESWYASKFPASQALGQVHLNTAPAGRVIDFNEMR